MKNMRKEERERSCERTSQKPNSPVPVHVSDHQRRFGDTALPRSATRRMKGRQGRRNGGVESESVLRELNEP
jgi:hypothetical protein